jgi:hypothetical protein
VVRSHRSEGARPGISLNAAAPERCTPSEADTMGTRDMARRPARPYSTEAAIRPINPLMDRAAHRYP